MAKEEEREREEEGRKPVKWGYPLGYFCYLRCTCKSNLLDQDEIDVLAAVAPAPAAAAAHFPQLNWYLEQTLPFRHSSMHSLQLQQLKAGKERRGGKEEETESGVRTSIDIRIDVSGVSAFAFKLSLNWIFYYVNIEVATKVSLLSHLPSFILPWSPFFFLLLTFAFSFYFLHTFHKDLRTNASEHAIIFKAARLLSLSSNFICIFVLSPCCSW